LQWLPRKIGNGVFVRRFVFDVSVPTGTYSDRRPVNIGNHFVFVALIPEEAADRLAIRELVEAYARCADP
jgi:hypothetical protein